MDYSVNYQKMEQAIHFLQQQGIDLWLMITSEGSDPSLPLVTGVATVGNGAFIMTSSGDKVAICNSIDAQEIVESKIFDHVYTYKAGVNSFEQVLRETILSYNPTKIALNYSLEEPLGDGLTTGRYRALREVLDGHYHGDYVSSESFLQKLRSIKTDAEVARIQKAIDITLEIYDEIYKKLHVGLSEKEIGQLFIEEMEKRGVVNGVSGRLTMPIVMKERIAHRPPGDAVVEPGDLVIMDFSVLYEGYCSDIARTVYFLKPEETEPPRAILDVFQRIYEAITMAGAAIKAGVQGHEVDAVARNHYIVNQLPEISHATGHQIGRDVHDGGALLGPRWERYGNAPYEPIEKGMVFTIEPTVFLDNGIHFIVEENVLVTEEGIQYLSKRQDQLICIAYR